nr:immunoglobulin heavy chain junction region [Mus musculus]
CTRRSNYVEFAYW